MHVVATAKAAEIAGKMLGGVLVTKQSGAEGKPVSKLFVCEKIKARDAPKH